MSKLINFSELIVAKFCHDLASSIGAIDNGIEFLTENNNHSIQTKAMQIIATAAKEAVTRLKFFQYLYGQVKSEGEADVNDLKSLVNDFFYNSKIIINWDNYDPVHGMVHITSQAGKLLLNMIYLASSMLIAGGKLEVQLKHYNQAKHILVTAIAKKLVVNENIEMILKNHELVDINIHNVQMHLTSKLASSLEVIINCHHEPSKFVLDVKFNNSK